MVHKSKYTWKSGAIGKIREVSAVKAGKIIDRLGKTGNATPKAIVDEARPVNSDIHNWFEWNDSDAAEKYREDQARDMVQQIVIITEINDNPVECRAFVTVIENETRQYSPIVQALSQPELRDQVIDAVATEISRLKNKLFIFKGLEEAIELMGATGKSLQKAKKK